MCILSSISLKRKETFLYREILMESVKLPLADWDFWSAGTAPFRKLQEHIGKAGVDLMAVSAALGSSVWETMGTGGVREKL